MGKVNVISPGLYTTIQDKGRFGFSKYGVPKSGVMDQRSFLLANALLGNDQNCAVIEWTIIPPVLEFNEPVVISVTGAICIPFLNAIAYKMNTQIEVKKGDVLKLKNVTKGCYGFVGIKNGFQSNVVLDSRSFYAGITKSASMIKNDHFSYDKYVHKSGNLAIVSVPVFWNGIHELHCYPGPEFELLSDRQKEQLFAHKCTISNIRSRMAIQLTELFPNKLSDMISSPVLPGTIQLTPSGNLIVLMRDAQTTGGYPRILQLDQESINVIAQKRVGEEIQFQIKTFL